MVKDCKIINLKNDATVQGINSKKVLVVGELHRDLFYRNKLFTRLATEIAHVIALNVETYYKMKKKEINVKEAADQDAGDKGNGDHKSESESYSQNMEELEEELRKKILKTIDLTDKKYSGTAYLKRGGNGNNSAELLAKIGVNTGLLTVIGEDSEWMVDEIKKNGINTSTIFKKKVTTPISTIVEDPNITKIFLADNLKKEMNFSNIDLPDNLFDSTLICFITPMDFKYKNILQMARSENILTAFTLELQKIKGISDLRKCVPITADFMFCNLDDAVSVCRTEIEEPLESMEDYIKKRKQEGEQNQKKIEWEYQVEKINRVDKILQVFARTRLYTMGKYGAWARFSNKTIYRGIIEVPVINRTGAGDVFAAGFIAKLASKIKDSQEFYLMSEGEKEWLYKVCLLFATAASAVKVSTGNTPNLKQIQDLILQNK